MEGSAYNGTGWVSALESEIRDKVDLGLCFMTNKPLASISSQEIHNSGGRSVWLKARQYGVDYYPVYNAYDRKRSDRIKVLLGAENGEKDLVANFMAVIEDFKPDVIQVFGSEHCYGLVARYTDIPVILLSPLYDKLFDRGFMTFTDDRKIVLSDWLSPQNKKRLGISDGEFVQALPMDDSRRTYLKFHRDSVFHGFIEY